MIKFECLKTTGLKQNLCIHFFLTVFALFFFFFLTWNKKKVIVQDWIFVWFGR